MKASFPPLSTIMVVLTAAGCGSGLDGYPSGGPSHPDEAVLWSLVVLPDIQHYIGGVFGGSPEMLDTQLWWIAENATRLRLKMVLCAGDITEANSAAEWMRAQDAFAILDGADIPYVLTTGNHDYAEGTTTRQTGFIEPRHFGVGSPYQSQTSFGGYHDDPIATTANSYHDFPTAASNWLVLALEFAPRDAVVQWARGVLDAHPDHEVILLTHAYLHAGGQRYDWERYGRAQAWNPHVYGIAQLEGGLHDGAALWDALVSQHPRFRMTFSGHSLMDGVARLTSEGMAGQPVHQMLFNQQAGVDGSQRGGNGYLRVVSLLDDGDTLSVWTFSPVLEAAGDYPWLDGRDHLFELSLSGR